MYCANCGEKLIEQAVTCPSCGTEITKEQPLSAGASDQSEFIDPQYPFATPSAPNPSRLLSDQTKKMILVIMAAAALIFLLFKFTGGAGNQATPENTVKGFMNAVKKENVREMVSYMSASSMAAEGEKKDSLVEMLEGQFEAGEINLRDYSILKVDEDENTAKVHYEVVYMEDGEKQTDEDTFELMKIDGKWFIDVVFGF
ncbi:DUF4878 domain-containing protein [Cohnella sp.]|uniref:DUF4878 domain-containing protein n=1 Tax=Cohnella sp. TaxID=1883426 RepID=UPI0035684649